MITEYRRNRMYDVLYGQLEHVMDRVRENPCDRAGIQERCDRLGRIISGLVLMEQYIQGSKVRAGGRA